MDDAETADEVGPDSTHAELRGRPVTINQVVAWNLAYFRKLVGLTGEELGDRLGWSKAVVSAAERSWDGKRIRQFSVDDVTAIALALDVPVIALLLPPPDAGTTVRYLLATQAGQPDMTSLLSYLAPTYGASSPAAMAFERRILALGASSITSSIMGPALEAAGQMREQAKKDSDDLLTEGRRQAEQIISEAEARAEALERDAQARLVSLRADQAIDDVIADARREANETLGRARREADKILTKARHQSGQLTSDARARAESLERDAQERHRQAMGSLVQSREELERRVDDLRVFEREYRSRLVAYLEGNLRDLRAEGNPDAPRYLLFKEARGNPEASAGGEDRESEGGDS